MNLFKVSLISAMSYASIGLSFVFSISISAVLGQDFLGEYGSLLAGASILVSFFTFGCEKFISKNAVERQDQALAALYPALTFSTVASILISFTLIGSPFQLEHRGNYLLVVAFALVCSAIRLLQRISRAAGRPLEPIFIELLFLKLCPYIFLLLFIYFLGGASEAVTLILQFHFIFAFLGLVILYYGNKAYLQLGSAHKLSYEPLRLLEKVKFFWPANVLNVFQKEVDTILCVFLFGPAVAGAVFFARRWYNALSILNDAFAISYEHAFALSGGGHVELYRKIRNVTFGMSMLAITLALPVFATLEYRLNIFAGIFPLIVLFSIQRILENLIGPVFLCLNMRGAELLVLKITAFSTISRIFTLILGSYLDIDLIVLFAVMAALSVGFNLYAAGEVRNV